MVGNVGPTSLDAAEFVMNIMLDKSSISYPDVDIILKTCKNTALMSTYQSVIVDIFTNLYEKHQRRDIFQKKSCMK